MITIRDFAAQMGCGVANIYKHIKQNSTELDGHIEKKGSKQYLDQHAQEFLSSLISPKAIKVEDEVLLEEINKLRALVVDLTTKNNVLITENAKLLVERSEIDSKRLLLEKDINILETAKKSALDEAEALKKELNSYEKTLFGLYKKRA